MDLLTIIIIAIGLSMDSFAVSMANGFSISDLKIALVFKIAIFLSVFQALMPILGYFIGLSFEKYIRNFDHWLAFILLSFLGIKMIMEARQKNKNPDFACEIKTFRIIVQSFATSIDALIIGISFALLEISIFQPVLIIGITTFIFSFSGIIIGKRLSNKYNKHFLYLGGIILILIGLKILLEHLT